MHTTVYNVGLLADLGRSPGTRNGNPLQYACLEHPMDRGAWWATVHGVSKESDTTQSLNKCTSRRYFQCVFLLQCILGFLLTLSYLSASCVSGTRRTVRRQHILLGPAPNGGAKIQEPFHEEICFFLGECLVYLASFKQPTFPLSVISAVFWERREVIGSRVWRRSGRLHSAGLWRENREFSLEGVCTLTQNSFSSLARRCRWPSGAVQINQE